MAFPKLFPDRVRGILPLLRELFPSKLMLTVEDVARVLGRTGQGATNRRANNS